MASVQRNVLVRAKSGRRTEDETHAADVVNHRRLVRLVHLAPQPPHMDVDEIGLGNELVVPHIFHQHGPRHTPLFAVRSMRSSSSGPTRITVSRLSAGRRNSASIRATSSTAANGLVR